MGTRLAITGCHATDLLLRLAIYGWSFRLFGVFGLFVGVGLDVWLSHWVRRKFR